MPLGERFPTFLPNVFKHSHTSQEAWILSNTTVRISNLLFTHIDMFEFWGFDSGVIEGCIHRRNLANKTGRQNRPWLLRTLIDEGVKLQRGGRLIWIRPYYTYTSFPTFTPLLYASSLHLPKENYSKVEKCVAGFHSPLHPGFPKLRLLLQSYEKWRFVAGQLFPDISKERVAFILKGGVFRFYPFTAKSVCAV